MKTILLLDDEPSVMMLLRCILSQHAVLEAFTADEALGRFRDARQSIGLLIADVTLPVSSGINVALSIRQENPALQVILTSGYPVSDWTERDGANLKRLQPDSVTILQKPFHPQVLLDAVRQSIGIPQTEKLRTAGSNVGR